MDVGLVIALASVVTGLALVCIIIFIYARRNRRNNKARGEQQNHLMLPIEDVQEPDGRGLPESGNNSPCTYDESVTPSYKHLWDVNTYCECNFLCIPNAYMEINCLRGLNTLFVNMKCIHQDLIWKHLYQTVLYLYQNLCALCVKK